MNYFATSPDYGKGVAERNLGRVLRELGAAPIVATKVEIMPADVDDMEAVGGVLGPGGPQLGGQGFDLLIVDAPVVEVEGQARSRPDHE